MVKNGKRLIVPTSWDKTLDPSTIVTVGKLSKEDKEENKNLSPVMWSVAPQKPKVQEKKVELGQQKIYMCVHLGIRVLTILMPFEKLIEKNRLACAIRRDSRRSHGERKTLKLQSRLYNPIQESVQSFLYLIPP